MAVIVGLRADNPDFEFQKHLKQKITEFNQLFKIGGILYKLPEPNDPIVGSAPDNDEF